MREHIVTAVKFMNIEKHVFHEYLLIRGLFVLSHKRKNFRCETSPLFQPSFSQTSAETPALELKNVITDRVHNQ